MNTKILLEIKEIARNIENSDNLDISTLKEKLASLHDKLVVLEFLEDSISEIEPNEIDTTSEIEVSNSADDIIESLDFSGLDDETITEEDEDTDLSEKTIEEIKDKKSIDLSKKSSLHEDLKKNTIQIGLNDRIAFVKRLFNGSQQDFHRVLSQVNTFSSIDEVKEFIDTMVRPEHNWENQEEYAERFMEIIEVKFQ